MTIHLRPAGGARLDDDGAVHRGAPGGAPPGGPPPGYGDTVRGFTAPDGTMYRLGGSVEAVSGRRLAIAPPPRTTLDVIPTATFADHRRAWPFLRGRLLTLGEVTRGATSKAIGKVNEYLDESTVIDLDDPPLTLNHRGQSHAEPPIIADYVSGSARIEHRELWASWCLRADAETPELAKLLARDGGLPLSISFREVEPVHIGEDAIGSRTPLVRQRHIEIKHVAVVAAPAYRTARLDPLRRAV